VEKEFNRKLSSDRIIVENYFGRICGLWGILSHKYKWNEANYDKLFATCLSLTNFHVKYNPPRNDDGSFYTNIRASLSSIGEQQVRKRKRTQERYRERRRIKLFVAFDDLSDSNLDLTQQPV